MKRLRQNKFLCYLFLTIGSVLCVVALNRFLLPFKLTMGGYSGFASIFYYLFKFPVGLGVLILNVPTFYFAFKYFSKRFCVRSLYAMAIFTIGADVMPVHPLTNDIFLASLYGGILMGIGLGVSIYFGGSTGGTDLLSIIIHRKLPSVSIGNVLFVIDAVVVLLTAIFAGLDEALFSLISVFLVIKCVDVVTEGVKRAKVFIVISKSGDEIKGLIYEKLKRGVTELAVKGGFTHVNFPALLCTVERGAEVSALKRIIENVDPNAFVISLDATEIIGYGFSQESKVLKSQVKSNKIEDNIEEKEFADADNKEC